LVVGIAGTAKNTGKTTTLSAIMGEARKEPALVLGLTSIGYDGEGFDNVTGLPKPRIDVRLFDCFEAGAAIPVAAFRNGNHGSRPDFNARLGQTGDVVKAFAVIAYACKAQCKRGLFPDLAHDGRQGCGLACIFCGSRNADNQSFYSAVTVFWPARPG
jgi:hypothetical protein